MSSIAYVTDQEMIEYHRLCGNRNMNFWRLSSRSAFKDFHKGDLLFFFARGLRGKKKGLVGYAHFDSTRRMSLNQMWKRYGTLNGYDSKHNLEAAILDAARDGQIPPEMNCLYLTDAVFFVDPVYPNEVGLKINEKLESYTYLDRDDPRITVRILRKAEEKGIDVWASAQSFEPEYIFKLDETRHMLCVMANDLGEDELNSSESRSAHACIRKIVEEEGFEYIKGTTLSAFKADETGINIALPFVYNSRDRAARLKDLLGRITYCRLKAKEYGLPEVRFTVLCDADDSEVTSMVKELNEHA